MTLSNFISVLTAAGSIPPWHKWSHLVPPTDEQEPSVITDKGIPNELTGVNSLVAKGLSLLLHELNTKFTASVDDEERDDIARDFTKSFGMLEAIVDAFKAGSKLSSFLQTTPSSLYKHPVVIPGMTIDVIVRPFSTLINQRPEFNYHFPTNPMPPQIKAAIELQLAKMAADAAIASEDEAADIMQETSKLRGLLITYGK